MLPWGTCDSRVSKEPFLDASPFVVIHPYDKLNSKEVQLAELTYTEQVLGRHRLRLDNYIARRCEFLKENIHIQQAPKSRAALNTYETKHVEVVVLVLVWEAWMGMLYSIHIIFVSILFIWNLVV